MGSGTDAQHCDARAEVALGDWRACARYGHDDGDHYVPGLDGSPIMWPVRDGDVRRNDGLIYFRLQEDRILQALRNLAEWDVYPGATQELVGDAKRRLRDAYKWLTGREPALGKGRS